MTSPPAAVSTGDVLWLPPADALRTSRVGQFCTWLDEHRGVDARDHDTLWRWSVADLEGFWSAIWDHFEVADHGDRTAVLPSRAMPGTTWFPGSLLNYAEHALRGAGAADDEIAVFARSQTRPDADRPYRAFGYPVIPALYILGAAAILLVLFVYRPSTTWPGLVIVLLGVPVYFAWKPRD